MRQMKNYSLHIVASCAILGMASFIIVGYGPPRRQNFDLQLICQYDAMKGVLRGRDNLSPKVP
jgi:hypothetical protein